MLDTNHMLPMTNFYVHQMKLKIDISLHEILLKTLKGNTNK